jgi:hypothetical protein
MKVRQGTLPSFGEIEINFPERSYNFARAPISPDISLELVIIKRAENNSFGLEVINRESRHSGNTGIICMG